MLTSNQLFNIPKPEVETEDMNKNPVRLLIRLEIMFVKFFQLVLGTQRAAGEKWLLLFKRNTVIRDQVWWWYLKYFRARNSKDFVSCLRASKIRNTFQRRIKGCPWRPAFWNTCFLLLISQAWHKPVERRGNNGLKIKCYIAFEIFVCLGASLQNMSRIVWNL